METFPTDHGSDRFGHVEASWRTEPPSRAFVRMALAITCPDCNVNVFITEDPEYDNFYKLTVAHDATCPWLTRKEAEDARADGV